MFWTWTHVATDPAELTAHVTRAMAAASSGEWTPGAASVNDLRAYLAYSATVAASIAGRVAAHHDEEGASSSVDPRPRQGTPRDRAALALALLRTPCLIGARALVDGLPPLGHVTEFRTTTEPEGDTGIAPLAIVAIAVASVGASAAFAYVAFQAAQVVDRYLARTEDTARLVETDARLLDLAAAHVSREKEAGHSLPLDAGTKAAVEVLTAAQRQILKDRPELKSGFEKLGGSWGLGGGIGLGIAVAAVVAIWWLMTE
ncbi:MAG: hypothetical protein A2Y61_00605 [Chloroflexi bacterium RBG_13_60_13]|nr:MAG: hypothetical protein A2Y61_00605 [Chloroflexi bacterium RBG_13_60_13]